jgi:hypothetical protein
MPKTSQPKRKKKSEVVFTPLRSWGGWGLALLLLAAVSSVSCGDRSPPPLWPQPPPPTLSEPIGVEDDGDGVQAAVVAADVGGGAEPAEAGATTDVKAEPDPKAKADPKSASDAKTEEDAK